MRCGAAGVLICEGFDSAAAFGPKTVKPDGTVKYQNLFPDGYGHYQGSIDHSIYASGGGSLHFHLPSPGPANISGNWQKFFPQRFSQNSTFYVQFRQRFSKTMLTNGYSFGNTDWKQVILYSDQSSCASVEITMANSWYRGFPQMYTQCGARGFTVNLPPYDLLLEQGSSPTVGYNCHYHSWVSTSVCADYKPDQWMTFYVMVHVGTWGQPNSTVKAWVGYQGQELKQFINMENYVLNYNSSPSDGWNHIMLTPYMSHKDPTVTYPPADTWYDELIVSTQPIAAP